MDVIAGFFFSNLAKKFKIAFSFNTSGQLIMAMK